MFASAEVGQYCSCCHGVGYDHKHLVPFVSDKKHFNELLSPVKYSAALLVKFCEVACYQARSSFHCRGVDVINETRSEDQNDHRTRLISSTRPST